jgi:hypothetical protein
MARLELKVNITGQSINDLQEALDLIKAQVDDGYVTGHDKNDTAQYFYEICEEND